MQASGVEREGPDTREVSDTLPGAVSRLSYHSSSSARTTGPMRIQRNVVLIKVV